MQPQPPSMPPDQPPTGWAQPGAALPARSPQLTFAGLFLVSIGVLIVVAGAACTVIGYDGLLLGV
jgi:hypothetical protein